MAYKKTAKKEGYGGWSTRVGGERGWGLRGRDERQYCSAVKDIIGAIYPFEGHKSQGSYGSERSGVG